MRKGWRFIQDTTVNPSTFVFASPAKQKAIRMANREHKMMIKQHRREMIKNNKSVQNEKEN